MDKNKPIQKPLVVSPNNGMKDIFTKKLFIFLIIAVVMGVMSGYIVNNNKGINGGNTLTSGSIDPSKISKGTVVGSSDTKIFKDTATGTLKEGGIEGEG